MKILAALRGAVHVENEEGDITAQLAALYDELLSKNNITEPDIVSIIFSVTPDITAKNPATALRRSGRAVHTALFSTLEPDIAPAHPQIIRLLMHTYMNEDAKKTHVYRNGAEILRPDLAN